MRFFCVLLLRAFSHLSIGSGGLGLVGLLDGLWPQAQEEPPEANIIVSRFSVVA